MEQIADGVWVVRGGFPKVMNVYLIEDDGGMTVFDAGIAAMSNQIAKAAAPYGGVKRVVLGHGHADHRGSAPKLAAGGAPVYCHPAEVDDAQGDGGINYFKIDTLPFWPARTAMPRLLKMWDGGPVDITDTLSEGDTIAGFDVVHLPGHAPGLIGLWRERDHFALVSDAFYTLDPQTGRKGDARVPLDAFNLDTEVARASLLKLSALSPSVAWPGHAEPLGENVTETLEKLSASG
jgi:glyoxylase-like metal-dependent hydrolase (beta-lactamase superfamily II)